MALVRRYPLWIIGGVGLAFRLFLAFHWFGNGDILTFSLVAERTEHHPLHTYGGNIGGAYWPYPPGYLLWLVAALKLSRHTGLAFQGLVQVAPILADLGIAIGVYLYLGWRGASERTRLTGFALVELGPVFIAISGYHGQLDPVATLAGLLGVLVWERAREPRRAPAAGLLLGIGGVLKTVPMLLLLPILISARSARERVILAGTAVGVAAIACLPFLVAEPGGFKKGLTYTGVPGRGGLSVLLDPGFATDRRFSVRLALAGHPNALADWVSRTSGPITLAVLIVLAWFLYRYRPSVIDSIVLLWLTIFAFSPNFLLQYLVWALPYFIMAGFLWQTALLQLAVIPALVITYLDSGVYGRAGADAYVVMMIALWVFWAVALVTLIQRLIRQRASNPDGALPPLIDPRVAHGGGVRG